VKGGQRRDVALALGDELPSKDVYEGSDFLAGPLFCGVFCRVNVSDAGLRFWQHLHVSEKVAVAGRCAPCIITKEPFAAPGF